MFVVPAVRVVRNVLYPMTWLFLNPIPFQNRLYWSIIYIYIHNMARPRVADGGDSLQIMKDSRVCVCLFPCLTKYHAMKTYYRNKSTVLRINLDTRWRWVITFMPRPPYSRSKDPQYHMDRRMGEPDSRSGRSGKGRRSHHYP